MRITTFLSPDSMQPGARLGLIEGDEVIDFNAAVPQVPCGLRAALESGVDLAAAAHTARRSRAARLPLAQLSFAPLVPEPGKVICLGLNYFEHAREGGRTARPEYPWFFLRAKSSLLAHGAAAWVPRVSDKLDYEAELAVVVGRRVPRHVGPEQALSYVFGYSCFNDISVRDFQKRTPQWTIGKNFDATGGFGPALVSAEELPAGASGLAIRSRLNGQVMQQANTREMIWGVAETIVLLAQCLTLEPGDVIAMGTPAGVGQSRTPPVWMKHGDSIAVEIEGIGTLTNPIRNEQA
jgi:acylpyruvate hydrolase